MHSVHEELLSQQSNITAEVAGCLDVKNVDSYSQHVYIPTKDTQRTLATVGCL